MIFGPSFPNVMEKSVIRAAQHNENGRLVVESFSSFGLKRKHTYSEF